MNWFNVLKNDWQEVANEVSEKLERALNEDGFEPEGEWDEEVEGYRDASDSTHLNGMIESRPEMEHEEHPDVTTEFDLYYRDSTNDELRVANYTGMHGIYITYDDWSQENLSQLMDLNRELDEWS